MINCVIKGLLSSGVHDHDLSYSRRQ